MARQGKLVLPAPEDTVEFATVIVDLPSSERPIKKASRPEIIVGAITMRSDDPRCGKGDGEGRDHKREWSRRADAIAAY